MMAGLASGLVSSAIYSLPTRRAVSFTTLVTHTILNVTNLQTLVLGEHLGKIDVLIGFPIFSIVCTSFHVSSNVNDLINSLLSCLQFSHLTTLINTLNNRQARSVLHFKL